MTEAIARYQGKWGDRVSAKLDKFGLEGTFYKDGTIINGTLGTCPQDYFAFLVWQQQFDPRYSMKKLEKM